MVPSLAPRLLAATCLMRYERSPSLIDLPPALGQPLRAVWGWRRSPGLLQRACESVRVEVTAHLLADLQAPSHQVNLPLIQVVDGAAQRLVRSNCDNDRPPGGDLRLDPLIGDVERAVWRSDLLNHRPGHTPVSGPRERSQSASSGVRSNEFAVTHSTGGSHH